MAVVVIVGILGYELLSVCRLSGGLSGIYQYYAATPTMLLFPVCLVLSAALCVLGLRAFAASTRKRIVTWTMRAGALLLVPFLVLSFFGMIEPSPLMVVLIVLAGCVVTYWCVRLVQRRPTRHEKIVTTAVIFVLLLLVGFMLTAPALWRSSLRLNLNPNTPENEAIVYINLTSAMDYDKWYPTYVELSYAHSSKLVRTFCVDVLRERRLAAIEDLRRVLSELQGVERARAEEALRVLQKGGEPVQEMFVGEGQ